MFCQSNAYFQAYTIVSNKNRFSFIHKKKFSFLVNTFADFCLPLSFYYSFSWKSHLGTEKKGWYEGEP